MHTLFFAGIILVSYPDQRNVRARVHVGFYKLRGRSRAGEGGVVLTLSVPCTRFLFEHYTPIRVIRPSFKLLAFAPLLNSWPQHTYLVSTNQFVR